MALRSLSTENMVVVTDALTKRGSPERGAIEAVPEAAALLPQIEAAHRGLLASQPIVNADVAKLSAQLAEADTRHDALIRGIHLRFESELQLATESDERAELARARDAVLPTGLTVITRSWTEQAGEARLREARVDASIQRTLTRTKTRGGTLFEHYQELQELALRIDRLERERAALIGAQTPGSESVKARNQWIRCINALAMVLAAVGVDETPILGRCRALEARVDGRMPQPEPEEPVADDPAAPSPVEDGPVVA